MSLIDRGAMPSGVARVAACVLALGMVLSAGQARGETNWGEEYAKRIKAAQEVGPLGDDAFGDNISLYTGGVTFTATDVSIPGNSALPVALSRVYVPSEYHNPGIIETNGQSSWPLTFPNMFEDWQLDIPHISAVYPKGWAGGWNGLPPDNYPNEVGLSFRRQQYWHGNHFHNGGGGGELLGLTSDIKRLRPNWQTQPTLGTKDGWVFVNGTPLTNPLRQPGNTPEPGFGIIGHAPNGNTYYFDWQVERDYLGIQHPLRTGYVGGPSNVLRRKKIMLYVSKIEDRFGNWVKYEWSGPRVTKIHSNDLRSIEITYKNVGLYNQYVDRVKTSTGREWIYDYNNGLSKVTNPDGSTWEFASTGHRLDMVEYVEDRDLNNNPIKPRNDEVPCSPSNVFVGNPSTYSIKHPAGATATYTFKATRHGRTNVAWMCLTGYDGDERSRTPTFQDVMSLQSKEITGPGLPAGIKYTYAYAGLRQGYQAQDESYWLFGPGWNAQNAPPMPNYKTVTVTEPDGTQQVHTFGKDWEVNEGQLLKSETKSGSTVLKTVANAYITDAEAASLPFPSEFGQSLVQWSDKMPGYHRPVKSTTIIQDGVTFSSKVAIQPGCHADGVARYCFDQQARATVNLKSSSLGYTKTDGVEYYDNLDHWLLGQVKRTTTNGVEVASTEYDAMGMPAVVANFGKVRQTLLYNADGTLQSVSDGNGNVTTLSSWYRGIPELIVHPDGSNEEADVTDDGTIKSMDDESDNRTCYAYDLMLRVKEVAYTSEAYSKLCHIDWTKTYQTMAPLTTAEYGLDTKQWKQVTRTGNGVKTVYFDALWRPVLVREEDLANTGTIRVSAKKYDKKGRVSDEYYAKEGASVDNLADFTLGTHTTYDAMGRVTLVKQDSELGVLTTKTEYLDKFERKITNPNLKSMIQKFQVYDVPTYDQPILIDAPENTRTTIVRDVFGKPLELNRGPTN